MPPIGATAESFPIEESKALEEPAAPEAASSSGSKPMAPFAYGATPPTTATSVTAIPLEQVKQYVKVAWSQIHHTQEILDKEQGEKARKE